MSDPAGYRGGPASPQPCAGGCGGTTRTCDQGAAPVTGTCPGGQVNAGQAGWRERVSAHLAVVPPVVLAPVVMGTLALGLVVAGVPGAILVAAGLAMLSGLSALAWPRLSLFGRWLRVAVLVFLLGCAIIRLTPA